MRGTEGKSALYLGAFVGHYAVSRHGWLVFLGVLQYSSMRFIFMIHPRLTYVNKSVFWKTKYHRVTFATRSLCSAITSNIDSTLGKWNEYLWESRYATTISVVSTNSPFPHSRLASIEYCDNYCDSRCGGNAKLLWVDLASMIVLWTDVIEGNFPHSV